MTFGELLVYIDPYAVVEIYSDENYQKIAYKAFCKQFRETKLKNNLVKENSIRVFECNIISLILDKGEKNE